MASMLRIRLQRVGRKNIPIFRVVLTHSQNSTKSGRYLEVLGAYDPRKNGIKEFKADRIKHWMSVGAKVTDTMHNLLLNEKIISGKKINVLPRKSPPKKEETKTETAPTPEVKAEATPAEAPKA